MNTQTETNVVTKTAKAPIETENPMQERHCGQVAESIELAAEVVFAARRLEACAEQGRSIQEGAGPVFVP
ncbi:MAG: hypothetical protein JW963_00520 [Anaerolineales bacterium]|nr:hypothetical protein [Anaerolineales bacterium]